MSQETLPIVEEVVEEFVEDTSLQELKQFLTIMEIVSQRNVFKINEYSTIGKFYDDNVKLDKWEPTFEDISSVVNVYDLISSRGGFQINEYEVVSKLYKILKKKQETLKKNVDNK